MKKTLITLGIVGLAVLFISLSWTAYITNKYKEPTPTLAGSFTPVQASQFTLAGSGVTNSVTTITLSSFKLPDPNHTAITMSMFGNVGYAVIEPQTSKIENISFTGVTQNANGTAILTGVSRGLSFYTPYAASSTLALSHAGGSYLILTNSGAFYGKEFLFANNTGTSSAIVVLGSTTPWRYDVHPTFTLGTQLIDKTYADALSFAGVATATESSFGGVWLATLLQQASSTNGAPNSPFVLQSKNATSSPGTNAGLFAVITQNNGKIHQSFLDLTQAFSWTGNQTWSQVATNILASSTQYILNVGAINATSSIKLGGVTISTTTPKFIFNGQTDVVANSGWATSTMVSIPANTLNASSTITIRGTLSCNAGTSNTAYIVNQNGTPFVTRANMVDDCGSFPVTEAFTADIQMNGSANSQITNWYGPIIQYGGTITSTKQSDGASEGTTAFNLTNGFSIGIQINSNGNALTLKNYTIIVTP